MMHSQQDNPEHDVLRVIIAPNVLKITFRADYVAVVIVLYSTVSLYGHSTIFFVYEVQ